MRLLDLIFELGPNYHVRTKLPSFMVCGYFLCNHSACTSHLAMDFGLSGSSTPDVFVSNIQEINGKAKFTSISQIIAPMTFHDVMARKVVRSAPYKTPGPSWIHILWEFWGSRWLRVWLQLLYCYVIQSQIVTFEGYFYSHIVDHNFIDEEFTSWVHVRYDT